MPNDSTAILSLPYILPAQAQKHITHNEALRLLDVLVQLVVLSRQVASPPPNPAEGDRYLVPLGATGEFATHDGQIACWEGTGWIFIAPKSGWQAEVLDEDSRVIYDGATWVGPEARPLRVAELGIATDADTLNRLAISSPATLFTHNGAGHQVKINKAVATDTASLLFQTGWSGRAEMGTCGSDNFEIKTSPNGTNFVSSLRALSSSGKIEFPAGVCVSVGTANQPSVSFINDTDTGIFSPDADQIGLSVAGAVRALLSASAFNLTVPITGSAVTQSATDSTSGRLTKVGDFGIGASSIGLSGSSSISSRSLASGFYHYAANVVSGGPETSAWYHTLTVLHNGSSGWRTYIDQRHTTSGPSLRMWFGVDDGIGGINWTEIFHQGSIVGTVSQAAGVPTGRVMERGSNANGEYVRFADGTQICTLRQTISLAIGTAFLGGFRSAAQTWAFPAAFVGGAWPAVTVTPESASAFSGILTGSPTSASAAWAVTSVTSQTAANRIVAMTATGRWF